MASDLLPHCNACSRVSALALRHDGCVMAVPVPDKVRPRLAESPLFCLSHSYVYLPQLDKIDDSDANKSEALNPVDSFMTLPLFSLLALEGGTGSMCAVPGSSIVAIAGKERGTGKWCFHLVDADMLLLLNSAPLLPPASASRIVALNAHAVSDGTVHVAAALLHSDGKVAWAEASLAPNGAPAAGLQAAYAPSIAFQLGNSVVQAAVMGDGQISLLLQDDGRARVKQVVGNSLICAALLEGNLLLAWRAK